VNFGSVKKKVYILLIVYFKCCHLLIWMSLEILPIEIFLDCNDIFIVCFYIVIYLYGILLMRDKNFNPTDLYIQQLIIWILVIIIISILRLMPTLKLDYINV
jgi:hypothetical protein